MALFGSLYRVGRHVCKLPLRAARYRAASTFSSCEFLNVNLNNDTGVAQVEMCRKPANAMSLDFLIGLREVIENLEKEQACKGIIFTSNLPKIFSAGLDMTELYKPDVERLRTFWIALQDMWYTLYSTHLVTVAAISGHAYAGGTTFALACDSAVIIRADILTGLYAPMLGHAPAGGCLISISCDARIFVHGNYRIGLNEVPVGIVVPLWLQDNMINVLGYRVAERALQHGKLFTPQEALQAGLVDEVVNPEDLTQAVEKQMQSWLILPDEVRQKMKVALRADTIRKFEARRQEDLDMQLKLIPSAACQRILGEQLEKLKKKK